MVEVHGYKKEKKKAEDQNLPRFASWMGSQSDQLHQTPGSCHCDATASMDTTRILVLLPSPPLTFKDLRSLQCYDFRFKVIRVAEAGDCFHGLSWRDFLQEAGRQKGHWTQTPLQTFTAVSAASAFQGTRISVGHLCISSA